MRNLTKTLAVLSLLAPASAHSLGIGGIKMHSTLNQNLNAEISLILSAGEKLSEVKVSLAPPDKFDEAGVPWNYFLSKIKFEPVLRPDGSAVIKVSSNEALKEPFLGLLLQVSWPKGSLYREFTVLVDPPEVYEQATVPIVRLPEQDTYKPMDTPASTYDQPLVRSPVRRSVPRSSAMSANRYGPTTRNDTLWKIAARASRSRNVSVEQMMIALYEANPGAFFKENINALSKGKTLKIPDREAVLKLSRKQAMAEYAKQTDAWRSRSTGAPLAEKPASSTVEQHVVDNANKDADNQLQLEAPSESTVSQNAVIKPGQDRSSTGGQPKTADKIDADAPNHLTGNYVGSDTAQKQITEMQQQLVKMQELLALKDQQLAALQQQAEASRQEPVKTEAIVSTRQATPTTPVTQQAVDKPMPIAQQVGDVSALPKPETAQTIGTSAPATTVASGSAQPKDVKPGSKPEVKTKNRKKPANVKQFKEESTSNYWILGGGGLGLLSLLGWLWWRKRKIDAKTDTESMFAHSFISTPDEDEIPPVVAPIQAPTTSPLLNEESNLFNVEPVGESSFLSEFTPSDFDAFDTDRGEIDPISEADVYLAYGRYQQAEELIRQAINEQPNRDECKLKLLEIFYASENKNAFEQYASELATSNRKDDKIFWAKVSEMGGEICPESALFTEAGVLNGGSEFEEEETSVVSPGKNSEDSLVDFETKDTLDDLSEETFDLFLKDTNEDEPEAVVEQEPVDFALSSSTIDEDFSLAFDTMGQSEGGLIDNKGIENDENDVESSNNSFMDFDLDSLPSLNNEEAKTEQTEDSVKLNQSEAAVPRLELEMFDFNLDDDKGARKTEKIVDASEPVLPPDDNDKNDANDFAIDDEFNFNFDLNNEKDGKNDVDSFAVSDLTDMDEFETKLDLARAYMDMGDEESAKEIVAQVLVKGSDEQKKIAQKFIDQLG